MVAEEETEKDFNLSETSRNIKFLGPENFDKFSREIANLIDMI